jgi:hypothetical protein
VNVGSRQAGRERGSNVTDVGYDAEAIETAARARWQAGRSSGSTLYGDGRAGERIAGLLAGVELTIEKRLTY